MIVKLIVLLVKLGFAGMLLKDRKDEVKLWCAVCLICASLFEVSEYIGHIGSVGQAGASTPYLTFVYQVLLFVQETGMPYALLMAAVSYLELPRAGIKRAIGMLLLLPLAITAATLRDGMVKFDSPFFLTWTSSYLIATIVLMLGKNAFNRGQPLRRKKLVELFIIIPNVLALLLSYYLSAVIHSWSDSVLVIVTLTFLLFLVVISRSGVLGVKLRLERQIAVGALRALTTGTSLLNHSLKNRLTNIDLLANRIADRSAEAGPDVRLIRQEIEHLFEMIRSIQHRTETIELSVQPYSLNELIRAAIDACAEYRSEKKASVRFRTEVHAVVRCDKVHLQEVFVNLLHNALDALPDRGGAIEIGLERTGRRLKLEFFDNGHGIAPEHLSKLWEPFFSTKTQQHNFGLGLTYCTMVVEKHDGKLKIESKPGEGTTVRLLLPMRQVAALAAIT